MADYADVIIEDTDWDEDGIVLSDNVVVQAGDQPVAISTKSDPSGSKGITLSPGAAINVSSGKTLNYRALGPRGGLLKIEAL